MTALYIKSTSSEDVLSSHTKKRKIKDFSGQTYSAWNELTKQFVLVRDGEIILYDVGRRGLSRRSEEVLAKDEEEVRVKSVFLLSTKQIYVVLFQVKKQSVLRVYSETLEPLTETIAYQNDYEIRSCTLHSEREEIVTVAQNESSSYVRTWNVRYCPMSKQKYKVAVRLSLRVRDEIVTCLCVDETKDELTGVLDSGKVCMWNFMNGNLNRCVKLTPKHDVHEIISTRAGFLIRGSEGVEIWNKDTRTFLKTRAMIQSMTTCQDDDVLLTVKSNGYVEMFELNTMKKTTSLSLFEKEQKHVAVQMLGNDSCLIILENRLLFLGVHFLGSDHKPEKRSRKNRNHVVVSRKIKQSITNNSRNAHVIKWKTPTKHQVYVSFENNNVNVWEIIEEEEARLQGLLTVNAPVMSACQIDGSTLCVGLQTGELEFWRLPFGDEISVEPLYKRVHVEKYPVKSVCCSENGAWTASAGAHEICLWYEFNLKYRIQVSETPLRVQFVPDISPDENNMVIDKCRPPVWPRGDPNFKNKIYKHVLGIKIDFDRMSCIVPWPARSSTSLVLKKKKEEEENYNVVVLENGIESCEDVPKQRIVNAMKLPRIKSTISNHLLKSREKKKKNSMKKISSPARKHRVSERVGTLLEVKDFDLMPWACEEVPIEEEEKEKNVVVNIVDEEDTLPKTTITTTATTTTTTLAPTKTTKTRLERPLTRDEDLQSLDRTDFTLESWVPTQTHDNNEEEEPVKELLKTNKPHISTQSRVFHQEQRSIRGEGESKKMTTSTRKAIPFHLDTSHGHGYAAPLTTSITTTSPTNATATAKKIVRTTLEKKDLHLPVIEKDEIEGILLLQVPDKPPPPILSVNLRSSLSPPDIPSLPALSMCSSSPIRRSIESPIKPKHILKPRVPELSTLDDEEVNMEILTSAYDNSIRNKIAENPLQDEDYIYLLDVEGIPCPDSVSKRWKAWKLLYTSRPDIRNLFVQNELEEIVDNNLDLVRKYWKICDAEQKAQLLEEMKRLYPTKSCTKDDELFFMNFLRGRIDSSALYNQAKSRREQSVRHRLASISISSWIKEMLEFYPSCPDSPIELIHLAGFVETMPSHDDLQDISTFEFANFLQKQIDFQTPRHISQFQYILSITNKFADRLGKISVTNFPKAIEAMSQNKQIGLKLPNASNFVRFATSVFMTNKSVSRERFVKMLVLHSLEQLRRTTTTTTTTTFSSVLTHLRLTYEMEREDIEMQIEIECAERRRCAFHQWYLDSGRIRYHVLSSHPCTSSQRVFRIPNKLSFYVDPQEISLTTRKLELKAAIADKIVRAEACHWLDSDKILSMHPCDFNKDVDTEFEYWFYRSHIRNKLVRFSFLQRELRSFAVSNAMMRVSHELLKTYESDIRIRQDHLGKYFLLRFFFSLLSTHTHTHTQQSHEIIKSNNTSRKPDTASHSILHFKWIHPNRLQKTRRNSQSSLFFNNFLKLMCSRSSG